MNHKIASSIPVLDLSKLAGSPSERAEFLHALRVAARDIGFFYLINHGVDHSLLAQVQNQSRAFF